MDLPDQTATARSVDCSDFKQRFGAVGDVPVSLLSQPSGTCKTVQKDHARIKLIEIFVKLFAKRFCVYETSGIKYHRLDSALARGGQPVGIRIVAYHGDDLSLQHFVVKM